MYESSLGAALVLMLFFCRLFSGGEDAGEADLWELCAVEAADGGGVGGAGGELWGAFGVAVAVFVPGGGDFDESFDVFPGVLAV